MNKWDSISWVATGIFILSLVLVFVFQNDMFLFLMALSYMLRPTLYALGLYTQTADERQMLIQYRSGNITLTILIGVIIILAIKANIEGKPADDFNLLLVIAIAARAISGILMVGNYREAAIRMTISVGAFWILFAVLSHGFSLGTLMESIPGISILAIGLIGIKKPMISSGVSIISATVLLFFVLFKTPKGFTIIQVFVALLVTLPLYFAAFCFYRGSKTESIQIIQNEG